MASNTKLYVGNLPQNCTDRQVGDLFSKFGKIVECDVIRDYAFVHFAESKNAMVAVSKMNNTEWNGTTLKVQPSYSSTKLYVGNLPKDSNPSNVRSLFSKFGKVVECDIIRDFGFIHFADTSNALKAVEKLNDKEWNGSTLRVQPSHSKVHVKPGMGNRGECIRCGNTGHLCRECPTVRNRNFNFKGGDIQEKTSATLNHLSKEISAMNGSIGGLYSFISMGKYWDNNNYRGSHEDNNYKQSSYSKDWLRTNYNGDHSNRYQQSNNNDRYNISHSDKRNHYSDKYPPPPQAPSRYRHRPYPSADERRLASSPMSESKSRPPSSSFSSSCSLSSSQPRSNSNSREMNPYFRPPPEYYEHRRMTEGNPHFTRSREH